MFKDIKNKIFNLGREPEILREPKENYKIFK